jgi:hypothetical protein
MGQTLLPAAVICEAALEFEEIDGLVYVSDPTLPHRKAMRRRVFLASFHNAAKLLPARGLLPRNARLSASFPTRPAAEIIPSDALMIASMVARVMFCSPLRILEIDASLIGGSQFAPNTAAVGAPGSFRN